MKKMPLLGLFLILFQLSACNNDDHVATTQTNESISGSWKLVNVQGGLLPENFDFEAGEITWTFNEQNGTVTVVNNNTDESKEDYFDSGTYDYALLTTTVMDTPSTELLINQTGMGTTVLQTEVLIFSRAYADGYTAKLIR